MSSRGETDLEVKSSRSQKHKHLDRRQKERSDMESRGRRIDFKTFVRESREYELTNDDFSDSEWDETYDVDSANKADWEEYVNRTSKK